MSDTIDINTTESTHGPVDLAANDGEGSSGTWSFSSPGVASTTVGFQDSHASGSGTLTFSYFNSANNYVSKNDGFKWSCKVSKPTPTPTPTKTVEKPTPTKAKPTPTKTTEKPTPTSTYHETQSTTPVAPKTSAKVGPTKAKSSSAEHSASVVANSSHGASAPETTPDNASSTNGSTAGLSLSSSNGDSSLGVITSSEISRAAAISSNHETSGVAGWIPLTGIGVLVITGIGGVIWYRRREDGSHTA